MTFVLFLFPFLGHAKVARPVQKVEALVDAKPEEVARVKTARIILADYALIRTDFEDARQMSDKEINKWLIEKTAYVSRSQASQVQVNSKIEILQDSMGVDVMTTAYRPQLYGRALVFKAGQGLIDVKGVGSLSKPQLSSHKTGLASLGEMIREFIFQKKVQRVLEHSGSGYQTVESYAVIDWGFDARELNGEHLRAGAILRQAHVRPRLEFGAGNHFASGFESKIIEQLLRNYGITSTGDGASETQEKVNIQVSAKGELVDFGAYLVKGHFGKRTVHYSSGEILSDPQLSPSSQPDVRVSLPLSMWGSTETGIENPRYDNLWVWSHKLAEDLKHGVAQPEHVQLHFDNFMVAGSLPSEFKNLFKKVRTAEHRKQELMDMIRLNLSLHETVSMKLVKMYFAGSAGKFDARVLEQLTSENFLSFRSDDIWKVFKEYKVFDAYPGLLQKFLLYGVFKTSDVYFDILKFDQKNLINEFIQKAYGTNGISDFLISETAKKDPRWPQWVASVIKTNWDFGPSFLRREAHTVNYPHLFKIIFEHSTSVVRIGDMILVLSEPHWKSSPELVDFLLDHIRQKTSEKLRSDLVEALLSSKTWKDHPRQVVWRAGNSSSGLPLCRSLFR